MEKLIQKFWQGKASKKELEELLFLLNKEDSFLKNECLQNWNKIESHYNLEDEKYQEILRQIHFQIQLKKNKSKSGKKRIRHYQLAAFLVLLISIGSFFYLNSTLKNTENATDESEAYYVSNPFTHKIIEVELADGSQVQLHPNSTLCISAEFGKENRTIELEGKGYFKVAKNESLAFQVISYEIITQALGTEFLVDSGFENVWVELISGKVSVHQKSNPDSITILLPGEKFESKPNKTLSIPSEKPPTKIPSIPPTQAAEILPEGNSYWNAQKNSIQFKQENLDRVFEELAQKYSQEISVQSENLEGLKFTGELYLSDSLSSILETLCGLNDLNWEEENGVIRIYKREINTNK